MNTTTRRWLIFFIVAVVVFIIANAISILLVRREPEIPATPFVQTNVDNTQSNFSDISFTGSTPDFPPNLPVATTQQFTTSEQDVVNLIVDQFSLQSNPSFTNLWTSQDWALSKSSTSLYTLVKNEAQPLGNNPINPELAFAATQNFIDGYFQQLNLTLVANQVQYFDNLIEAEFPVEVDDAQIAKVPFSYTIAGYPVFYEQTSLFPFEVWVTSVNDVQKMTYYPQFIQVREVDSKPLISIDQAIENINQLNQGSVVSYDNTSTTIVSLEEVSEANLNQVALEYRVDSSTNFAFPFYRFSGTALLSGIETPIEVTTPAVVVQ
jgi:hypothetical protein